MAIIRATNRIGSSKNCEHANAVDQHYLSSFKQTVRCNNATLTHVRYIEPLYGILRYPNALPCRDGRPIIRFMRNVAHIITDDASNLLISLAPQRMYFDIGASLFRDLSQKWMLKNYEKRGVTFDRHLMWEAKPRMGPHIINEVPARFRNAYQYFNIPASADVHSPLNPLNMMKSLATKADYVVFKLDIDNPEVEYTFIKQILNDSTISSLIDEFFWEPTFAEVEPLMTMWQHDPGPLHLSDVIRHIY